jgi:excisionase family DNA binding protein
MTHEIRVPVDRDVAAHLVVAIRRHRAQLERLGAAEPGALATLEATVQTLMESRELSGAVIVGASVDDVRDDLAYLSRGEIARRVGVSLSTVDRWIKSGSLPSTKRGRMRRVSRTELEYFLAA